MFRSLIVAASLLTSTFAFTSCDNDSDGPSGAYAEDGVFVTNEGNFTQSNGSVSYYNTNSQQVQNGIFAKENNGQLLGDVIQDMDIQGERAFIVANNSNKIEVVNASTFKSVGVIEGLQLPRYFEALNNQKGYVTETVDYSGSTGRVSVIDLSTYTVTNTIEVGIQPEQLLIAGDKLYVANSGSNTVIVINTATDAVESTIPVSDVPKSLALDRNNNIWVLSAGKVSYTPDWTAIDYSQTTAGALSMITAGTQDVQTYTFGSNQSQPGNLAINDSGDRLYFTYDGGTFEQSITATSLPTTPIIDRSFYGLGVDPDNGYIYGGDPNGFTGDGTVYIYRPDGTKVGEFRAGIAPNGFVFN
ncbi:DUF5074 domain-containing protein [Pontibacter brevis]